MAETEKITGKELQTIFNGMVKDKTFVRMHLVKENYDQLTMIKDVRKGFWGHEVIIDLPDDIRELKKENRPFQIEFEFNTQNGLYCTFGTDNAFVSGEDIRFKMPPSINRIQRRKNFRLEAPSGTLIHYKRGDQTGQLRVMDISLGGILCISGCRISSSSLSDLNIGEVLPNIQLEFPDEEKGESHRIHVIETEVVRSIPDKKAEEQQCALEFKVIDRNEKKRLKDLLYHFQRNYLKTRIQI